MSTAVETPVQVLNNLNHHDKYHEIDELDTSIGESRVETVIPRDDTGAILSPSAKLPQINTTTFRGSSNLYSD